MKDDREHYTYKGIKIISGSMKGGYGANILLGSSLISDLPSGSIPEQELKLGKTRQDALVAAYAAIDKHPVLSVVNRREHFYDNHCFCYMVWSNGKIHARAYVGKSPVGFETEASSFEQAEEEFLSWTELNKNKLKCRADKNREGYVEKCCPEGTTSLGLRTSRVGRCWNCHLYLAGKRFDQCSSCGFMVCDCGACGCSAPRRTTPGAPSLIPPRLRKPHADTASVLVDKLQAARFKDRSDSRGRAVFDRWITALETRNSVGRNSGSRGEFPDS